MMAPQLHEPIHLLLIEDEEYDVRRIQNTLKPFADRIVIRDIVSDGRAALQLLEADASAYDVVIMDFQIPGGILGENLIRKIKKIDPALQIIVITKMTMNITDFKFANRLLEAGAMWYCTKYPGDIEEYIYQPTDFILSILNASERRKLMQDRQRSEARLAFGVDAVLRQNRIIGETPAIQKVRQQIEKYADTAANVLIVGPSGTGKEVVATQIHYRSRRKFEAFVPINCGSLPENLIESELFGFEKGSFTGASARKQGLFEIADGGTVFLDEIGELPPSAQAKLLRVLQQGELDKIGRTGKVKVDVRVVAATNKNIVAEVEAGRFRQDLYYRLNVVCIEMPALKDRRADIPLFVEHFMSKGAADMGRVPPEVAPEAMELLMSYDWPGNVRELQNVVQRLLFSGSDRIDADQVRTALQLAPSGTAAGSAPRAFWQQGEILPWRDVLERVQREYFQYVRSRASSDAEAARMLGLAPPNYHRACKKLGLK